MLKQCMIIRDVSYKLRSYFLEGIHFSITPIQPKCSANQGRVEFPFTFYCLKNYIKCKCYRCLGKKNEALLETYPWGII